MLVLNHLILRLVLRTIIAEVALAALVAAVTAPAEPRLCRALFELIAHVGDGLCAFEKSHKLFARFIGDRGLDGPHLSFADVFFAVLVDGYDHDRRIGCCGRC